MRLGDYILRIESKPENLIRVNRFAWIAQTRSHQNNRRSVKTSLVGSKERRNLT
jgi:hypothetical protein